MDNETLTTHNITSLLQESRNVDPQLYDRYLRNRAIDEPACTALIVMYSVLITLGALGNILVIVSVIRKPAMRTPRNMFILNLAISDLLLCAVVMPLTLIEIITKYFPFGKNDFICKAVGPAQATSIFVSTISITAIALDRYQVIVYPTKESLQLIGAIVILGLIWLLALVLASPLFIVKELRTHNISLGNGVDEINFCIEDWPSNNRAYYSGFSLIFQYILPIIIVSAAYMRISYKLRYRFAAGFVSSDESSQKGRRQLRGRRLQRTNTLLCCIAVIFCISWLPLNIFNLVADLDGTPMFTSQPMMICYAVCHMMGMSSACSNPVLYGCLNDNFWKEFKDILCISSQKPDTAGESQKMSIRNKFQKVLGKSKPDLVAGVTEYHPCNTASSDMTVLTKC